MTTSLWRTGAAATLLLVLTALTSCGDDEPDEAKPDAPTATASENQEGDETFDVRLEIPDGPDWLAEGFGSLWVKSDNGAVTRISPEGEVIATIDADIFQQPVCQGLGVTEAAVWACATEGTLIRIDPATNEFTTVDVPKINDQGRLTASDGLLWLLTGDGDQLEGLSDDGTSQATIQLGTFCNETSEAADAGVLWVACSYEGQVLRVDLAGEEVTGRVTGLPQARSVSVSGDVWVAYEKGLARVDPGALEMVDSRAIEVYGLRATDGGVWVRAAGDDFLTLIDSRTGKPTSRLAAPDVPSPGDVIDLEGRQWATAYDDDLLVRVR